MDEPSLSPFAVAAHELLLLAELYCRYFKILVMRQVFVLADSPS